MPNANTGEAATKNNNSVALVCIRDCNELYPDTLMSINWRASLVPAAAVIPAPRAYINVAAVKTPVVGFEITVRTVLPRVLPGSRPSVPAVVCAMREWKSAESSFGMRVGAFGA